MGKNPEWARQGRPDLKGKQPLLLRSPGAGGLCSEGLVLVASFRNLAAWASGIGWRPGVDSSEATA